LRQHRWQYLAKLAALAVAAGHTELEVAGLLGVSNKTVWSWKIKLKTENPRLLSESRSVCISVPWATITTASIIQPRRFNQRAGD
jgi:hypothetical protein